MILDLLQLVLSLTCHQGKIPTDSEPDTANPTSSTVVLRNRDTALRFLPDSAAGQSILERSWRGLEIRDGVNDSALELRRSSIARG